MKNRIWELDFLRGLAIILMVFDHLMYDFMYMPVFFGNFITVNNSAFNRLHDLGLNYWISDLRFYGHYTFVFLFLLISGISFTFSKNNLSRGLKLTIVAIIISLITYGLDAWVLPGMFTLFGIIHLYAVSIIIVYLLRKLIKSELALLFISAAIIIYGFVLRFYDPVYVASLSLENFARIILGMNAYGADHFGLIPFTGVILLGTVFGKVFYKNKVSYLPQVKVSDKNIFIIAGRKSLLIFITHQIVLVALIYLIGYLFGYRI